MDEEEKVETPSEETPEVITEVTPETTPVA